MSKIIINNHSDLERMKSILTVNNIDTVKVPTDVLISLMTLENIDFSFINENPNSLVSITNNKDIFTGIMFQNNEKIDCHICLEKLEKGEKIMQNFSNKTLLLASIISWNKSFEEYNPMKIIMALDGSGQIIFSS